MFVDRVAGFQEFSVLGDHKTGFAFSSNSARINIGGFIPTITQEKRVSFQHGYFFTRLSPIPFHCHCKKIYSCQYRIIISLILNYRRKKDFFLIFSYIYDTVCFVYESKYSEKKSNVKKKYKYVKH